MNMNTGVIVTITDEEMRAADYYEPLEKFPEWQRDNIEAAKEILYSDDIPLPSQFDIHEYCIMERFCLSIEDEGISDILYNSIKGRGAFRRFKDNIYRLGIEKDWYKYRDDAIRQIAIDWCEENGILYLMEGKK